MSNVVRKATGVVQEKVGKAIGNERMQVEGEVKKREAEQTSAQKQTGQQTGQHTTGQHVAGQHPAGQHTAGQHTTGQQTAGTKVQGHKDHAVGDVKQKAGVAVGSHNLEAKGAAQKAEGTAEKAGAGHYNPTGAGAGVGPMGAAGIHGTTGGHGHGHDAYNAGQAANLAGEPHHGTTGVTGDRHGAGYSTFGAGAQAGQYNIDKPGHAQGLSGTHAQRQGQQHTAGHLGGEHGGQYTTTTHPQDHHGLAGSHAQEHGQYTSGATGHQTGLNQQDLTGTHGTQGLTGRHPERQHEQYTDASHQGQGTTGGHRLHNSTDPIGTNVPLPEETSGNMHIPGAYQDTNTTAKRTGNRDSIARDKDVL